MTAKRPESGSVRLALHPEELGGVPPRSGWTDATEDGRNIDWNAPRSLNRLCFRCGASPCAPTVGTPRISSMSFLSVLASDVRDPATGMYKVLGVRPEGEKSYFESTDEKVVVIATSPTSRHMSSMA